MPAARFVALLVCVLTAGCAETERVQPSEPPDAGARQDESGATPGGAVSVEPVVRPSTPSPPVSTGQGAAKPDTPAAQMPARVAGAPAPAEPARKKESAALAAVRAAPPPSAAKPAAPPLDLALLEKRLKETNAIGVFTKLTLKNQVDDLLDRFRAYYQGRTKTTLAELRQPYDMLILKVLSLLQDSDPSLAGAIVASREAIWGILSDREKFSSL